MVISFSGSSSTYAFGICQSVASLKSSKASLKMLVPREKRRLHTSHFRSAVSWRWTDSVSRSKPLSTESFSSRVSLARTQSILVSL